MDSHMDWLLSLATRLRSKFYDTSIESTIKHYLTQCIQIDPSIKLIDGAWLNQQAPLFIICNNPTQVFRSIIEQLKVDLPEAEQSKFRPLTIITKLAHREFILDIGGNQLIYGINSKFANDSLIKSIICRNMYSLKQYFNQIIPDSNMLLPDSLSLVDPLLDTTADTIAGGRSKSKKKSPRQESPASKTGFKIKVLGRLVEYIKTNPMFMGSLIYLNTMNDIDNHAMDIIYSDGRAKDGVIDYLKILIQGSYDEYRFEINSHAGYFVPFDFRLRKLSCMVKHRKSGQTSYLVNLYNAATYDPIPSYRLIDSPKMIKGQTITTCQLVAHPLVRMRFLYLDQFFLASKSLDKGSSQFDRLLQAMVVKAYSDLKKIPTSMPLWVGVYRDEGYDKNQENMRSNVEMPYEIILI
jgi:hypothetical protein